MIVDLKTARIVIWILVAVNVFLCYVTINQNISLNKWKVITKAAVKQELKMMEEMKEMERLYEEAVKNCAQKN